MRVVVPGKGVEAMVVGVVFNARNDDDKRIEGTATEVILDDVSAVEGIATIDGDGMSAARPRNPPTARLRDRLGELSVDCANPVPRVRSWMVVPVTVRNGWNGKSIRVKLES